MLPLTVTDQLMIDVPTGMTLPGRRVRVRRISLVLAKIVHQVPVTIHTCQHTSLEQEHPSSSLMSTSRPVEGMALSQKSMTNLHTSRVRVKAKNSIAIPLLHQVPQTNTQISCERNSTVGMQSNTVKVHMTSEYIIGRLIIQVGWTHLVTTVDLRPISASRHTVTFRDLLRRETLTY